uniref:Nudix hydrolase domain-containing protein n=1 Tax=viral metagenome TaxID=1070528 RepID=A0A6C0I9M5_9ZZZZ
MNWKVNNYQTWNYKKLNKNNSKYSAGILPYTYNVDGKCLFLLGKDNEGDWSDFGGKAEYKDFNEPQKTACREFYEETLGVVLDYDDCYQKVNNGNPIKIISKTLNGSPYYMYLLYIEHHNHTDHFNKTSNFLKYLRYNNRIFEKSSIRWFTIDTLLNCIDNKQSGGPISLRGVFHKTIELSKEQIILLNN